MTAGPAQHHAVKETTSLTENVWTPLLALLPHLQGRETHLITEQVRQMSARIKADLGLRGTPLEIDDRGGAQFVRASGIAGTLTIGVERVDIIPKIFRGTDGEEWRGSIMTLLARARRKHFTYSSVHELGYGHVSFIDHIALAYRDALEMALRAEPIQTYSICEETSPYLRGNFAVDRQLRSVFERPHLIECDTDFLDSNNNFNHLLRWAGYQLASSALDRSVRRQLNATVSKLPRLVGPPRLPSRVPTAPPAQYRHYADAIDIASAFARGEGSDPDWGSISGYGYVLNMERLFEAFVERSFSLLVKKIGAKVSVAQETRLYAQALSPGSRSYYTRPDNVLKTDGKSVLVVDAKYKTFREADERPTTPRPNNGDLYQLVASLASHQCDRGLLVYPAVGELAGKGADGLFYWRTLGAHGNLLMATLTLDMSHLATSEDLKNFDVKLAEAALAVIAYSA